MSTADLSAADLPRAGALPLCPLSLSVASIGRLLNFELADDPVYDGLELQWFDDESHGTGMLAFLCRRADRQVDYYVQSGLRLDRAGYEIAGGTRSWNETAFEVARLEVSDDGIDAEARFTDVDGRLIEVRVDDRDGRRRRRGRLLAPVGADIERPAALLLVWMSGFDLVRATGSTPVIRIGGREGSIGRLPGTALHRRRLIKYAAPLCAIELNRSHEGPLAAPGSGAHLELAATADRSAVAAIVAEQGGHRARLALAPALPDVAALADGAAEQGVWHVTADGARLTGGTWGVTRVGNRVALAFDVNERWRPGPLPWLMRLVTTAVPVFRRWPTTYRWRAEVRLDPTPSMTSGWERIAADGGGRTYRRVTGS